MPSLPALLAFGRDDTDVNRPWLVGGTGIINGSGEPAYGNHPHPMKLCYGRTVAGVNVPVAVDADGTVHIDWNL